MKKITNEAINAVQFYHYGDSVVGEVIGYDSEKCYVKDSKTGAVVSYRGCGEEGDVVLLSVVRSDSKRGEVMCLLDSVISYAPMQEEWGLDLAG